MNGGPRRTVGSVALIVAIVAAWFVASAQVSSAAQPTPLFDSALCRFLGCAVVYNGQQWQLYVLGGEPGRPARLWAGSDGRATIGTIEADQRTTAAEPGSDQGSLLGVDLDGDQVADWLVDPGSEGFLDAGASVAAFPLTATTELSLAQRELQHSFWIVTNVPLAIHGQARLTRQEGQLAAGFAAHEVGVEIDLATAGQGTEGLGGALPAAAEVEPGIHHLADLMGASQRLVTLRQGTVGDDSTALRQQLVRVVLRYRFAGYDLSQGIGELGAEIEYSMHNP